MNIPPMENHGTEGPGTDVRLTLTAKAYRRGEHVVKIGRLEGRGKTRRAAKAQLAERLREITESKP